MLKFGKLKTMNFVTPKVFLIGETKLVEDGLQAALTELGVPDWESINPSSQAGVLVEFAGKSCYNSFDTSLNKNLTKTGTRDNFAYIQEGIIGKSHGSVLEHATVTFFIKDVSRVVTHEIVRHRAGTAFSQTSGRYVRTDHIDMYLPKDLAENDEASGIFMEAIEYMETATKKLAEVVGLNKMSQSFDFKKKVTSAIRRIIGNGQANNLVLTANHRAWRHMIEMRTDRHAEEEIRLVFSKIFFELVNRYPEFYDDHSIEVVDDISEIKFINSKV